MRPSSGKSRDETLCAHRNDEAKKAALALIAGFYKAGGKPCTLNEDELDNANYSQLLTMIVHYSLVGSIRQQGRPLMERIIQLIQTLEPALGKEDLNVDKGIEALNKILFDTPDPSKI